MFEFLDSIDVEQPFFYLRPCTRCLKCESHIMPTEQRDGRNFWRCRTCWGETYVNVGLGARNQVTGKIVWSERHEQASLHGTSLEFAGVKPQPIVYGINDGHQGWIDADENGFLQPDEEIFIEWYEPPISTDTHGFSSLLAAILFFRKHHKLSELRVAETPTCWSGELISSAHELVEVLLNDPPSRKFQTTNANFNRAPTSR